MTTDVLETEAKYDLPVGTEVPALDGLPGVTSTARPEPQRLEAEYYDTDDLRLLRAGVTLRRRSGGSDEGWHLKLPAGPQTRREIREPLGSPNQPPPPRLASLVRGLARGGQLQPVARMTTVRQLVVLLGEGDESLAEVAIDDVSAQSLGARMVARTWHELEVELTGGTPKLLRAADAALRGQGLQPAGRSAKLERALGREGAGPCPPELTAASPAGEVIRRYLRSQADALTALDPMVRMSEPGSVHKMRITARRLRSALQAFGEVAAESAGQVTEDLKWLGGLLGTARDAEVLSAHLHANLGRLPVELVIGPVQARVQGHFASTGADGRRAVLAALDTPRYFALLNGLDRLADTPALAGPGSNPATRVLPPAVRRAYRRTRRRMDRARDLQPGQTADAALHEARKAAKRARYAAEAVMPAFGHDARRFAGQMKNIQSVLGEHQDTVAARQALRQLGINAHLAGENAFSYGVLYEQNACDARELRTEAVRAWQHAARPRYRRWLHGH
ncbi:MAG TPA: CYTH and CHAD domain-containing protein [Streptosporangiaceae bacterium]